MSPAPLRAQDLNASLETMIKSAAAKVAPSVVQIITQGGNDLVVTSPKGPVFRKAIGPTTGLIIESDGYVISSAFNFVNQPTVILVAVPGRSEPLVAKLVATDKSRMLALLKIDATGLPVPAYVPKKEILVGQWSIALGRTLDSKREHPPSISVGIISATNRIWGKALQTDAKISPINYGGPLVDIQGRVLGVLIPASPQGEDVTAGFEWYDGGIGFAIPLEDIRAVLPRLKEGKDLHKGLLGIRMKSPDIYGEAPVIGAVARDTAAAQAGLKAGDTIIEIDGQPVVRMAQVLQKLGTKYEGDKISLKYRRGKDLIAVNDLRLVGQVTSPAGAYLGILPLRDDPRLGLEIRYVFSESPAAKAGLAAGDRIVKFGTGKTLMPFTGSVSGREQFVGWMSAQAPGEQIKLEVKKADGKSVTVTATLGDIPGARAGEDATIPEGLPLVSTFKKALAPLETLKPNPKASKAEGRPVFPERGFLKRNTPDGEHLYWLYAPEDYVPDVSYGLLIWLHPPGKNKESDFENITDAWGDYCKDNRLIMVCPASENEAGWTPSEADSVVAAAQDTIDRYTIDRRRVVAHGLGVGGQMAVYLGFGKRELIRGVVATGAVVNQVKDNMPNERLAFYLSGGSLDPLIKSIADSRTRLQKSKFPVVFREIPGRGREYFEDNQIREVVRWIDCLDRI